MNFLSKLFGWQGAEAVSTEPTIVPHPVMVNPPSPAQLKRHTGRLVRLYDALTRYPATDELLHEIATHKAAIQAYGHTAPTTAAEARELLNRLET